jgi:hypothetical protein
MMDFEFDSLFDKPQKPRQRKRGGQPGNVNALKHGRYSRRLSEPSAEADLEEEIILLRTLVRRISEMAEGPDVELAALLKALNVIGATIDRLARLLKVQKEFGETGINGEAAIIQAISEVARELGIQ